MKLQCAIQTSDGRCQKDASASDDFPYACTDHLETLRAQKERSERAKRAAATRRLNKES